MSQLSCAVIGAGSLPAQCGQVLLDRGHRLTAVLTDDETLANWADGSGTPRYPAARIAEVLRADPPDYLFSVVNGTVLPADVLALPRRAAINYHDAPLPRYAGMHATSWALLAGEPDYAISWHVMAPRVDAGAVLRQPSVPVLPSDTAFTLNGRCYATAVESFAELVADLAAGRHREVTQDLGRRTYFGRYRRPPAAGVLCWDTPADQLDRLVRALDFGPVPNPLGAPKLVLPDAVLLVRAVAVTGVRSTQPAGTVVEVAADRIVVATTTEDLAVTRLAGLGGTELAVGRCAGEYGLRVGDRLPVPDPAEVAALRRAAEAAAPAEPYWARRLANLRPALPGVPLSYRASGRWTRSGPVSGYRPDLVLAAFTAYLGQVNGGVPVDVWYSPVGLRREPGWAGRCQTSGVPVRLAVPAGADATALAAAVGTAVRAAVDRGPYPIDLVARVPALAGNPALHGAVPVPVGVLGVSAGERSEPPSGPAIVLGLDERAGDWWLWHDPAAIADRDADLIVSHLAGLCAGLAADSGRPVPGAECASGHPVGRSSTSTDQNSVPDDQFPDPIDRSTTLVGQAPDQVSQKPAPESDSRTPVPDLNSRTPPSDRLVELLATAARDLPDRVAIRHPAGELSYRELLDRLVPPGADLPAGTDRLTGTDQPAGARGVRAGSATDGADRVPADDADGHVPPGLAAVLATLRRGIAGGTEVTAGLVAVADLVARLSVPSGTRVVVAGTRPAEPAWTAAVWAAVQLRGTLQLPAAPDDGEPALLIGDVPGVLDYLGPAERPLRAVCLIGNRIRRRDRAEVAALAGEAPVAVGYALPGASICALGAETDDTAADGSGRPLAHVAVRAADLTGRPLPTGFVGELQVSVLAGPWTGTGERGRVTPAGYVQPLGRVDDVVPRYGLPVPIDEIEDVLAGQLAVSRARVLVEGDDLTGYVVPGGRHPATGDLLRALTRVLPPVLVPTRISLVAELPERPASAQWCGEEQT